MEQTIADQDIAIRNDTLNRRNQKFLTAKGAIVKISNDLSESFGKPVLVRIQVSALTYLLGHGENPSVLLASHFKSNVLPYISRRGVITVSSQVSRIIDDLPKNGSCTHAGVRRQLDDKAYTLDSVQTAVREMDEDFLLQYSPSRFSEALRLVSS